MGPLPLLPGAPRQSYPFAVGSYHLQMSTNGGSTWNNLPMPPDMQSIQNWFVSSAGQVYASPTISFSIQPTAIPGTIQPATLVPYPTSTPQTGVPSAGADISRPSPMYQPASFVAVQAQGETAAPAQFIRRYDPNTNSWSNVTSPPTNGFMLQLTPVQSTSGAVLWFVGMGDNGQEILYRYVV